MTEQPPAIYFDTSVYRSVSAEHIRLIRAEEDRRGVEQLVNHSALVELFSHLAVRDESEEFARCLAALRRLKTHAEFGQGYRMLQSPDLALASVLFNFITEQDETADFAMVISWCTTAVVDEWPEQVWAVLKAMKERRAESNARYAAFRAETLATLKDDPEMALQLPHVVDDRDAERRAVAGILLMQEQRGVTMSPQQVAALEAEVRPQAPALIARSSAVYRRGIAELLVKKTARMFKRAIPDDFLESYVDGMLKLYPVGVECSVRLFRDFGGGGPRNDPNDVMDAEMLFSVAEPDNTPIRRRFVTLDKRVSCIAAELSSKVILHFDDYVTELALPNLRKSPKTGR